MSAAPSACKGPERTFGTNSGGDAGIAVRVLAGSPQVVRPRLQALAAAWSNGMASGGDQASGETGGRSDGGGAPGGGGDQSASSGMSAGGQAASSGTSGGGSGGSAGTSGGGSGGSGDTSGGGSGGTGGTCAQTLCNGVDAGTIYWTNHASGSVMAVAK